MILIIGGAYQGKATWAKNNLGAEHFGQFPAEDAAAQTHLERFSRYCTENGLDVVTEAERYKHIWENGILISREIGCGIVPMDATERAWRENHGRLLQYLAKQADRVVRVFCGIAEDLK